VKFGESLEQIAASRRVPVSKLVELNAIAQGEIVHGGTVLLVPRGAAAGSAVATASGNEGSATQAKTLPAVVVPADGFVYPNRKRVFYRVVVGDTLPTIATSLHATVDDLRRWNDLDPVARLQDGMTLQVFVPIDVDLSHVALLSENDVRVLPVGSEEFFAYWEGARGRKRLVVAAKAGETIEGIGRQHQVSAAMMERVNHRPRSEVLKEGERVVVYPPPVPGGTTGATGVALAAVVPVGGGAQRMVGPANAPGTALPPLPPIEMLPELP
jgi:membrane-bound lytic murein transglycosylase D